MLSSIVMTSALAVAVLGSPLQHLEKRVLHTVVRYHTKTLTDWVYVNQQAPTTSPAAPATTEAPAVANKEADNGSDNGDGWGDFSNWHPFSDSPQPEAEPSTTTSVYQAPASSQQPAPSKTAQSGSTSDYQKTVIDQHNIHRANHSVADLQWSDSLASSAQEIAQSCVYAHNTQVQGGGYGQNIAAGVTPDNVGSIVTNMFYNGEEPYYDNLYGQDSPDMSNFESWGHFSQLVWKGTTHVACATQHCPGGLANTGNGVSPYFTVCNYSPPGNYANEYGKNVLKPLGHPTVDAGSPF